MSKDEILAKLKDFGSFVLCIIVLILIGYFTGFLKGFAPQDFIDAYNLLLSKTLHGRTNVSQSGANQVAKIGNYQPSRIPAAVLRGAKSSDTWLNVLNSGTKAIFYVYDDSSKSSKEFHYKIQNSVVPIRTNYNVFAYSVESFRNIRTGTVGPSKICNSIDECNEQRRNAADYTALAEFFKNCGNTMCIINPAKGQYIRLKTKNSSDAVKMINGLRNW